MTGKRIIHSELHAPLIALLLGNGGQLDIPFDLFGEAVVADNCGQVAVLLERGATGVQIKLVQSERAELAGGTS